MTDYQLRIMLEVIRDYVVDHPDTNVTELVSIWNDLAARDWPDTEPVP